MLRQTEAHFQTEGFITGQRNLALAQLNATREMVEAKLVIVVPQAIDLASAVGVRGHLTYVEI